MELGPPPVGARADMRSSLRDGSSPAAHCHDHLPTCTTPSRSSQWEFGFTKMAFRKTPEFGVVEEGEGMEIGGMEAADDRTAFRAPCERADRLLRARVLGYEGRIQHGLPRHPRPESLAREVPMRGKLWKLAERGFFSVTRY